MSTRGALFEKTAPLDPPQKLLIKAVMLCSVKESMQTMTAFGLFMRVKKSFDTHLTLILYIVISTKIYKSIITSCPSCSSW